MNMIFATATNNVYIGIEAILAIIVVAGVLGVARANYKNNNKNQSTVDTGEALTAARALIDIQKEQLSSQASELKDLQNKYFQSQKDMAKLEGQVQQLSTLQLDKIAETLVAMRELLQTSARTLAIDTREAASAVKEVKTTLRNKR